jgi:hypothetical protein
MRQRKLARQMLPETPYPLRHFAPAQSVGLSIGSNEQSQTHVGEERKQPVSPQWSALAPWRRVTATLESPRVAHRHGYDRNSAFVIELVCRDAHPFPQPRARCIREWLTAFVCLRTGSLARDEDTRSCRYLEDRSGSERERIGARATCANFSQERIKRIQNVRDEPLTLFDDGQMSRVGNGGTLKTRQDWDWHG